MQEKKNAHKHAETQAEPIDQIRVSILMQYQVHYGLEKLSSAQKYSLFHYTCMYIEQHNECYKIFMQLSLITQPLIEII